MYRGIRVLAVVSVFIFLLTGLAYATCSEVVKVIDPSSGAQINSGKVSPINICIDWSSLAGQVAGYKLSYSTDGGINWTLITTRNCITFGGCSDTSPCCPTFYPWEVPYYGKNKINSKVKVVLLDADGNKLAKDVSDTFTILGHGTKPLLTVSCTPTTVAPGVNTACTITNGQPPYTVDTSDHSITTIIDGGTNTPPVKINTASFSVGNTLSAPCADTTVNVIVTDVNGETSKTAVGFTIDCP